MNFATSMTHGGSVFFLKNLGKKAPNKLWEVGFALADDKINLLDDMKQPDTFNVLI